MRRIGYLLAFAAAWVSAAAWAQAPVPEVKAAAILLKAGDTVLREQDVHRRLPPASLTKVMTALLVVERFAPDSTVTVSTAAARETGSRLGIKRGDRFTERDLLAAALIQSANDACHALADKVAGNEARFVALMNRRAREWGLRDSHFVNACGHDHPRHYASAADLARLAERAMANPDIAGLVALSETDISDAAGHRFHLATHNALLGRYAGTVGLKTGYTPGAGKCLIAVARRDGRQVLLVLLNAPNRWWDAADLLDRAFADAA